MKGEEKSYDGYTNEDERGKWASKDMKNPGDRPSLHYTITDPETGNEFTDTWKYDREAMDELIETGRVKFPDDPDGTPRRKLYTFEVDDTKPLSSWIEPTNTDLDVDNAEEELDETILATGLTGAGTRELKELFDEKVYDFPKSASLVRKLVKHTVDEGDIVMDFFAGSGTTGHAVMEHNAREDLDDPVKYVLVQLDEELDEPRAGFEKLSEICRERLKRASEKIDTDHEGQFDGGLRVFGLDESNFTRWQDPIGPDETKEAIQAELEYDFRGVDDEEAGLIEVMLLEGFTPNAKTEKLTSSEPNGGEDEEEGDSEEIVWYRVTENDAELFVSFAQSITLDVLTELDPQPTEETPVVCLDSALTDSAKDNIARTYTLKTV
jgi:adenine-specific DNA-methyltransferase